MTDNTMGLRGILGKSSDANMLCEMIGVAAERQMALEVGGLTGADHGERSENRSKQRNGYREWEWLPKGRLDVRSCSRRLVGKALRMPKSLKHIPEKCAYFHLFRP
jgi:hypothetical protein